jgi:hypothetical protein
MDKFLASTEMFMTFLPLSPSADAGAVQSSPAPRLLRFALALTLFSGFVSGCASSDSDKSSSSDNSNTDEDDSDDDVTDDEKKPDGGTKAPPKGQDDDDDKAPPPIKEDDGVEKCAGIRKEAPAPKGGVDVIFLIDNSGSMFHAIAQVTSNMEKFVQDFESSNADTRVVVISRGDPAAGTALSSNADRYRFVPFNVDSKALFTIALSTFGTYQDFLRPNAATQFVMITDDQDRLPPATFKQEMEKLLGHPFTQHAVASESVMGLPCINEIAAMAGCDLSQLIPGLPPVGIPAVCGAAAVGEAYYTLADQTNGEKLSICKGDWTSVFDQLKSAVIEAVPLPCDYPLDMASAEKFDKGKVNIVFVPENGKDDAFPKTTSKDKCGDKLGWHYDDEGAPTTINLCPKACEQVQRGGAIDIEFGCPPPIVF